MGRSARKLALSGVVIGALSAPVLMGCGRSDNGTTPKQGSEAVGHYRVPSGGMLPTLAIGQDVTTDIAAMRAHPPAIGDIVVFHPPHSADLGNALCGDPRAGIGHAAACDAPTARESSQLFVKRVVARPGDRLSISNGHVVRNGIEQHEIYIAACGGGEGCTFPRTIIIPRGEYFLLGDNRGLSDDSRFWGPVPRSWIVAVVRL